MVNAEHVGTLIEKLQLRRLRGRVISTFIDYRGYSLIQRKYIYIYIY